MQIHIKFIYSFSAQVMSNNCEHDKIYIYRDIKMSEHLTRNFSLSLKIQTLFCSSLKLFELSQLINYQMV